MQHLEKLIIPNCKKIPNSKLCDVLRQNPSLLHVDISNKTSPKIDSDVLSSLAHSCRHLRVLKLSDYRIEDPTHLLVLCGRDLAGSGADSSESQQSHTRIGNETSTRERGEQVVPQLFDQPARLFGPSTHGQPSSGSVVCLPGEDDSPPKSKHHPLNCNTGRQAGLLGYPPPHCLTHYNQFEAPGAPDRPAASSVAPLAGDLNQQSRSLEAMTGSWSLRELVI